MRSLKLPATATTLVSRSRFLAVVAPVADREEAQALLARMQAEHPDATHHCFARILGPDGSDTRSADDGEPGGTAGAPMLEVLRKNGLTDVAAVVVRWFGGTKLGAGGLVRAYSGAVRAALSQAAFADPVRYEDYELVIPLAAAGAADHLVRTCAVVTATSYGERCTLSYRLRAEAAGPLAVTLSRQLGATPVCRGATLVYE